FCWSHPGCVMIYPRYACGNSDSLSGGQVCQKPTVISWMPERLDGYLTRRNYSPPRTKRGKANIPNLIVVGTLVPNFLSRAKERKQGRHAGNRTSPSEQFRGVLSLPLEFPFCQKVIVRRS